MSDTKDFSLGAVLSATTGTLLCEIADLYEILNFLTGESLYTHQLPRAFKVCAPYVLQQHPDLVAVDTASITRENWRRWLATATKQYGKTRTLTPIPAGAYQAQDPIRELIDMREGRTDGILVVKP
jgi:hypothetical protein